MSFRLLARNPVATVQYNFASGAIGTGAWVQIVASLPKACSAIEIFNPSGSTLKLSTGAATKEGANVVPYTILPGGSAILLAIEIAQKTPLSLEAVDQSTGTTGILTMNFFG
jgi:hypothetical protein